MKATHIVLFVRNYSINFFETGLSLENFRHKLMKLFSLQAFQTFTKPDVYQIFVDFFKKVEEKHEVIKQYVVKIIDHFEWVAADKPNENWSTISMAAEHLQPK